MAEITMLSLQEAMQRLNSMPSYDDAQQQSGYSLNQLRQQALLVDPYQEHKKMLQEAILKEQVMQAQAGALAKAAATAALVQATARAQAALQNSSLTSGNAIPHTGIAAETGEPKQETRPVTEILAKPSRAASVLAGCIKIKRPVCLWGQPGIGKSQIVAQVAEKLGMDLIDIRAVLLDAVDVRGLPVIKGGDVDWAIPLMWPREGCRPTVIFLDEITRAPSMVQNALFQLILDRKIGDYRLPDNCVVVAASNLESDGGGVTRMNAALCNRFLHVNVTPDLDDWSRWAVANGVSPMTVAFLRWRTNLLHVFDKNAHAFPTPRSWQFVSEVDALDLDKEDERIMISGAVGEGAATEYLSFVSLYRTLPSIDAILLDPMSAPVPTDVATLYAVSSALGVRSTPQNFGRVIQYLGRLPQEFMVFAVRDATTRDPDLTSTPEFTKFAVKFSDLL